MSENPRLSVVIPAYNEEKTIGETLRRVDAYLRLKSFSSEILVSTDGSTDGTDRLVRTFADAHSDRVVRLLATPENHGKGGAVRRAALAAAGERVLVTDADLSAPIKEMDKLLEALDGGCDVVIGSRAVRSPGADVRQSFKRALSGRIFNFFVRALVIKGFRDTQCGFKCFTREAAQALFSAQTVEGFSFDVEILYLAVQKKFKIKEVPVMWKEGRYTKIRLFGDSLKMLKQLFDIRRRYRL